MTREGYMWLALVALAWLGATDVRTAALGVSLWLLTLLAMKHLGRRDYLLMSAFTLAFIVLTAAPFLIAAWSLLGGGA